MKRLIADGDYFGEEEMKCRDPLLYEQMVGRYLTSDEIVERAGGDSDDTGFFGILMQHIQSQQNNELYATQVAETETVAEDEESDQEEEMEEEELEDEDDDEIKETDRKTKWRPINDFEKKSLQTEFRQLMQMRFLNGEDKDFDYRDVDENAQLDCTDVLDETEQERYFEQD